MKLLSSFILYPLRIYTIPKRIKNKKGIATFPAKHIASYQDYSVDFSNQLCADEKITQGKVICNHKALQINSSFYREQYLTAFLSGGRENLSFYLTFIVHTNKGNEFVQEIILPTYGFFPHTDKDKQYHFIALSKKSIPPDTKPPLNALAINDYYFINNKNSYIVV